MGEMMTHLKRLILQRAIVSRNAQITKDIKELKANLSKEKVDLTELIENRKNNELHVIELILKISKRRARL